jgi:tetratricopeptide (TPR) repeat protein
MREDTAPMPGARSRSSDVPNTLTKPVFVIAATIMVAVATAVRVHNALSYPSWKGYDGFGHFTYIWFMAETGRVPLPTSGWSFFHPPLYYAFMASLWNQLEGVDAFQRLALGSLVMAFVSLTHAAVAYVVVRRFFPNDRLVQLMAVGLMLFVPVHLYTAPFIGNEGLSAALCSITILCLLNAMQRPNMRRLTALGISLGLAMLTKFTAAGIVFASLASIGTKAWVERDLRGGARRIVIVTSIMLAICGWYYWRNVSLYGTPFKMSRDEFMVRHVENSQPQAEGGILRYVLFDPVIFRRPMWPRGFTWTGDAYPGGKLRALRESVWTGVYANAWFDGYGGWFLPPVTSSNASRRAGQILLTFGIVPTGLILIGIGVSVRRLWRRGWDDATGSLLYCFATVVILLLQHTRAVPIPASVKASYLLPTTVAIGVWFAVGFRRFCDRYPRLRPWIVLECTALAVVSALVFAYQLVIPPQDVSPIFEGSNVNMRGVVYYAAHDRDRAREQFAEAAKHNFHLAHENLAALAFEDGNAMEALYRLRLAARMERHQSFGRLYDRAIYDRLTQGEYRNSQAVAYHELGWGEQALAAATEAAQLDTAFPEAHYNIGQLKLEAWLRMDPEATEAREVLVRQAIAHLSRAVALDPAFSAASTMLGVARILDGDCARGSSAIKDGLWPPAKRYREFPIETGRGIPHAASIGRHRRISRVPAELDPAWHLTKCEEAQGGAPAVVHASTDS